MTTTPSRCSVRKGTGAATPVAWSPSREHWPRAVCRNTGSVMCAGEGTTTRTAPRPRAGVGEGLPAGLRRSCPGPIAPSCDQLLASARLVAVVEAMQASRWGPASGAEPAVLSSRCSTLRLVPRDVAWLTRLMMTVAFLHTADVHVSTFRALLAQIAPAASSAHLVDADLLADARLRGIDASIETRVLDRLRELARHHPGVIVCTCSTLGAAAERVGKAIEFPVVRVDRPMAEAAVAIGARVALVAAVESTLGPTRQLFEECASSVGSTAVLVDAPCLDAWELFEAGDYAGYRDRVARHIRGLRDFDVVMLAQASMAPVADLVADLSIPVLSSPRLAVLRALELAGD